MELDNKTDINKGLTTAQAEERVKSGRANGNFNVPTKSVKQIVKENLFTLFNLVNVILAALVISVGSYRNVLFMGVIICNIAIGIFQEVRAKRTIDKLSLISAPKAYTLRDGSVCETAVSNVVLDDIIVLNTGNQVCADGIVVSGECEVDESMITGESEAVTKHTGDEILSGSFIVCGETKAQVIRVGKDNYANKIASGAKYIKKPNSEMMNSINKIIRVVSACIVPIFLILLFKSIFITQQTYERGIVSTVAAIIGMIPEGLVLLTSIALAVSTIRLAQKKTLCQDLYCIETLARVDVLCLDKTGTITEGSMLVNDVVPLKDEVDFSAPLTALTNALTDKNPTFCAIKEKFGGETDWVTKTVIPFSSAKKWSAAAFDSKGTYIIGAAEFILGENNSVTPKTVQYSEKGKRVLLLAHSDNYPDGKELPRGIEPLALIIISDKIRAEAKDTLDFFAKQGVELKVISGDNPVTVANIAKEAGMKNADKFVDASTLKSDKEIYDAAQKYTVFGRVTPYQKLELVKSLKAQGHKVAMTGDGVNDVLALKEADCSVAMQSGSDAARNVSHLVLLDSNFASMPLVVAEGRRSINNIQRSASLFLVKTIYAFILAISFVFITSPYPFSPIQLTLISGLAIGIPSFLLALEPNHNIIKGTFIANVMTRALPGGLTVALSILALVLCSTIFSIDTVTMSTMATFLTGGIAFIVLGRVCYPFNKMRMGMFILLAAAFVGAVSLFSGLFLITPIELTHVIVLLALLLFAAGLFILLNIIVGKVIAAVEKREKKESAAPIMSKTLKKVCIAAAAAVCSVFLLWFGVVMTDYLNVIHWSGKPVFAQQAVENGIYKGLGYEIDLTNSPEYETFEILGNKLDSRNISDE